MKLRIHNSSIRLRLSRPEVAHFGKARCIEERLEFGPDLLDTFRCALVQEEDAEAVTARYLPGVIEIVVPPSVAERWSASDEAAIEGVYGRGERPIKILVEKDYECLHHEPESGYEAYPNPAAGAARE